MWINLHDQVNAVRISLLASLCVQFGHRFFLNCNFPLCFSFGKFVSRFVSVIRFLWQLKYFILWCFAHLSDVMVLMFFFFFWVFRQPIIHFYDVQKPNEWHTFSVWDHIQVLVHSIDFVTAFLRFSAIQWNFIRELRFKSTSLLFFKFSTVTTWRDMLMFDRNKYYIV